MPEPSGQDLLSEWRKLMESLMQSAAAMGTRSDLARQLMEPMQRQLELVQEILDRERRLQRQVTSHLLAPVDAVFDLLAQSGEMLRRQAEALDSAGRALEETAALVTTQAELFERTLGIMREPSELARAVAGLERRGDRPSRPRAPGRRPRGS
ncbi:MAG TPA: hypothetical protein VFN87_21800 [Solirubrobacteraceae bacterium]|nr:hypothetical protein [Solirubrobacteraceae bacterium]